MQVKIIGKMENKGTSKKTGRDYHFISIFYNGRDTKPWNAGLIGQMGLEATFDPTLYDFNKIEIGKTYNIEWGPGDTIVAISEVK